MAPLLTDASMLPVIDIFRVGHLTAMALGFGTMLAADFNMVRRAGETILPRTIRTLELMHRLMFTSIFFAWVSGIGLLILGTSAVTPALIMKVLIVALLSFAAVLAQRLVMPVMRRLAGRAIVDAPFDDKIRMALCAALSVSSWVSALILGASILTATSGWGVLLPVFGAVYLFAFAFMLRYAVSLHNRTLDERDLVSNIRVAGEAIQTP